MHLKTFGTPLFSQQDLVEWKVIWILIWNLVKKNKSRIFFVKKKKKCISYLKTRHFQFIYLISTPVLFEFERELCYGSVKNTCLFESYVNNKRRVSGRSHVRGLKAPKRS